jgi:hypothetical protein
VDYSGRRGRKGLPMLRLLNFLEVFVTKARQKIQNIFTNSNYNRAALQQIKAHKAIVCGAWRLPEY